MVTAQPEQPVVESPEREVWEVAPGAFPLRLQLPSEWELTDERLLEFGSLNEEWCVEADCTGGLLIMAPAGTQSGKRELDIGAQLFAYCLTTGQGQAFGASSLFRLPNGWRRAPDAAWVSDERLAAVEQDDEGVWAVCPDFVVEVRSANDQLTKQQEKMEMWVSQGARLGWLVDPREAVVWVYRPEREAERIERPDSLTATEIADDLTIDFSRIWPRRDPEPETA